MQPSLHAVVRSNRLVGRLHDWATDRDVLFPMCVFAASKRVGGPFRTGSTTPSAARAREREIERERERE